MKFYYMRIDVQWNWKPKNFNLTELKNIFNKLLYVFLLRYGPRKKGAGKTHAQEGKLFFSFLFFSFSIENVCFPFFSNGGFVVIPLKYFNILILPLRRFLFYAKRISFKKNFILWWFLKYFRANVVVVESKKNLNEFSIESFSCKFT